MRQIALILKSAAVGLAALVASGLLAVLVLNIGYKAGGLRAVAINLNSPIVWAVVTVAFAAAYWEYRRASGQ